MPNSLREIEQNGDEPQERFISSKWQDLAKAIKAYCDAAESHLDGDAHESLKTKYRIIRNGIPRTDEHQPQGTSRTPEAHQQIGRMSLDKLTLQRDTEKTF